MFVRAQLREELEYVKRNKNKNNNNQAHRVNAPFKSLCGKPFFFINTYMPIVFVCVLIFLFENEIRAKKNLNSRKNLKREKIVCPYTKITILTVSVWCSFVYLIGFFLANSVLTKYRYICISYSNETKREHAALLQIVEFEFDCFFGANQQRVLICDFWILVHRNWNL